VVIIVRAKKYDKTMTIEPFASYLAATTHFAQEIYLFTAKQDPK
jgi:hypothetical protein